MTTTLNERHRSTLSTAHPPDRIVLPAPLAPLTWTQRITLRVAIAVLTRTQDARDPQHQAVMLRLEQERIRRERPAHIIHNLHSVRV